MHAAGPAALRHRVRMQAVVLDRVAAVFGARKAADRFACKALAAGITALVTQALVDGGSDAVLALHAPVVRYTRNVMQVSS